MKRVWLNHVLALYLSKPSKISFDRTRLLFAMPVVVVVQGYQHPLSTLVKFLMRWQDLLCDRTENMNQDELEAIQSLFCLPGECVIRGDILFLARMVNFISKVS